jgi:hypothetical protein
MSMAEWWRRELPSALSLRAFGAATPMVLLVTSWLAAGSLTASWLAWFFFTMAAFGAAVVLAQIAGNAIRGSSALAQRWSAFSLVIIVGPVTVVGSLLIAGLAGTPRSEGIGVGPLVLSTLLAAWLLAGGRLSYLLTQDALDRERILVEVAREKALALESTRLLELDRERLLEDVRTNVTDRLIATHGDGGNPEDAAAHLRSLINEAVRPLSHELRDAYVREEELVDQVRTVRVPGPSSLLSQTGLVTQAKAGDVALAVAVIGASVIGGLVALSAGVNVTWMAAGVAYSAGLSFVLLLAAVRAHITHAELATALETADRASTLVRLAAWVTRRRLANTMHGEVQGRILASALRIKGMNAQEESAELSALAADLRDVLDSRLGGDDWQLAWDRLIEMWQFTIEFHLEWDEQVNALVAADPVAGSALVAAAGEAITNAVRHGRATIARVKVTAAAPDAIGVDIVDNGTAAGGGSGNVNRGQGEDLRITPGMGSETLDAVCLRWELVPLSNGHRFTAVIPVRDSVHVVRQRENSEHSEILGYSRG